MALRSGDPVQLIGETSEWPGEYGEVFRTDPADPLLPYKVILDNGWSSWFGPDELRYAPERRT